jgi:hypothetical protein
VNFSGSKFNNISKIFSCTFNGKTYFENITDIANTLLIFKECEFGGTTYFDSSNISSLQFNKCNFDKKVSFTNAQFNKLFLNNVKFDKPAYFDNVSIKCLNDESYLKSTPEDFINWKITIRTIKQELLKINSRFDYNKFRNYEVAAYYQELDWKWKGDFKDKTILWATKHVTGFDHSWRKALRFVLLSAFVFFSLFFISENYKLPISFSGIPQYITGYFRFLLVTDLYNPLVQSGKEYISNNGWNHIFSWFFFILGKIFIAFGIYEMIQAFRKFKA